MQNEQMTQFSVNTGKWQPNIKWLYDLQVFSALVTKGIYQQNKRHL